MVRAGPIDVTWRGEFTNHEMNLLHAAAFDTRVFSDDEWNWRTQLGDHSLGWVTARQGETLVGFVDVISDGCVHPWIQDVPGCSRRCSIRGV